MKSLFSDDVLTVSSLAIKIYLIHYYNHNFTNVLMSAIPHVGIVIINIILHLMIHKHLNMC